MVQLRSLALVCQEMGIPDIEVILKKEIDGISIEEWANQNLIHFLENQKLLSEKQKEELADYLKKCEEVLRYRANLIDKEKSF